MYIYIYIDITQKHSTHHPQVALAKASQSANENRILSTSLQDQLAVVPWARALVEEFSSYKLLEGVGASGFGGCN